MPPPTASDIARCALDFYNSPALPAHKGKPKPGSEFTVYSAIVASDSTNDEMDLWVVCCATGSKCCAAKLEDNGLVLHDSHAEVLVRRALMRVLWSEVKSVFEKKECLQSDTDVLLVDDERQCLLEYNFNEGKLEFKLKKSITLHMYISDSPCGDASIYDVIDRNENIDGIESTSTLASFTGAKVIISDTILSKHNDALSEKMGMGESMVTIAREAKHQILGALRLKSGRSNIPNHLRSMSHCCSDKICRWMIYGMQGRMLTKYIVHPIRLSSLCVSRDPRTTSPKGESLSSQLLALQRALTTRVQSSVLDIRKMLRENKICCSVVTEIINSYLESISINSVHLAVVEETFPCGKSVLESVSSKTEPINDVNVDHVLEKACLQSRKRAKIGNKTKLSAAGISFNWDTASKCTEITIGSTGRVQGKKPKTDIEKYKSSSRLSKRSFLDYAMVCHDSWERVKSEYELNMESCDNQVYVSSSNDRKSTKTGPLCPSLYCQYKECCAPQYSNIFRQILLTRGALSNWVISKNSDFKI